MVERTFVHTVSLFKGSFTESYVLHRFVVRLVATCNLKFVNYLDVTVEWDGTRTTARDMLVSVELLAKTLSDGSVAHDIQLNFSENV